MKMNKVNIVALDGYTLNPGDLSWEAIEALGSFKNYDRTPSNQVLERAKNAHILLVNKVQLPHEMLSQLPQLQCICVTATGYNNIDLEAAASKNIVVCNAVGYSTNSVAQHVFALILGLINQVETYQQSVRKGDWSSCPDFCYTLQPILELAGKTIGIYGFGKIGQKVAALAMAFDMQVLATHKHPERDAKAGVKFVDLATLFSESDIVTLHAPLTNRNEGIVNAQLLSKMKPSAYLINTGRGKLINEADLRKALVHRQLAGAGLDVLSEEPPLTNNVLLDAPNCIITPHIAWASQAARARLMNITAQNINAFLKGKPQNVVQ